MNANDAIWKPNVTVAAVIEQAGKFLLVEEQTGRGALYNQPAGHLEPDESLIASVVRETLEGRLPTGKDIKLRIRDWQADFLRA